VEKWLVGLGCRLGGEWGWLRHLCIRWGSGSSKGKGRFWGFLMFVC